MGRRRLSSIITGILAGVVVATTILGLRSGDPPLSAAWLPLWLSLSVSVAWLISLMFTERRD
ncbi:MAG: hypothetical protein DWQ37_22130 [Planctomycetota bacterium]|mgnify:CR=1 FL=1|nr:MAG: hypothetical protein DWQ37_22130 [Planctomycetota bacterium]